MRAWGRVYQPDGSYEWVKVETDANGSNDFVYATTLAIVLQISPGESPFYANYGIPAQASVLQQVPPDYYVYLTQQQFSGYFGALVFSKTADFPPTYLGAITLNTGVTITTEQVPK